MELQVFNRGIEIGRGIERKEILDFINKERNEGNCEPVKGEEICFSPSLCLSKLIRFLEDGQK